MPRDLMTHRPRAAEIKRRIWVATGIPRRDLSVRWGKRGWLHVDAICEYGDGQQVKDWLETNAIELGVGWYYDDEPTPCVRFLRHDKYLSVAECLEFINQLSDDETTNFQLP
jgi:hypothetical protein